MVSAFQGFKEEFIRDRVVVGIQNSAVSEQLQLTPSLILKDAVLIARQAELSTNSTDSNYEKAI